MSTVSWCLVTGFVGFVIGLVVMLVFAAWLTEKGLWYDEK